MFLQIVAMYKRLSDIEYKLRGVTEDGFFGKDRWHCGKAACSTLAMCVTNSDYYSPEICVKDTEI